MTIRKTEINDKNLCVVEFSEDAAVLEAEKSKVFHAQSKNFNIPGFRRGKAPRSLIEKMYGTGVFLEDAVNNIINAHYTEIVDAAGKKIVSRPEFDIVSMDENEIVLKAEMYVKPEVSIEGYKGIEASVVLAPVTDEEIEEKYKSMAEQYGMELDMLKKYLDAPTVRNQLLNEKAIAVVVDSAKAEKPSKAEKTEGEEEKKPAKKTAKKAAEGEEEKKPAAKKTTKKAAEGEEEKKPAKKTAKKAAEKAE